LVRPRSNLNGLAGILGKITLLTGDITDGTCMIKVLSEIRPEIIFHFAAQSINGIPYKVPQMTADTNVRGTVNLF
jgi:GDP-D-mannose dehydratase